MEKLALAIRLAARYREESYEYTYKDKYKYKLSVKQAADKAINIVGLDNTASELIIILLETSWGYALTWAESTNKQIIDLFPT